MSNGSKVPRFVLSYARRDADSFLERFFTDLRRELVIREGLNPDPKDPEAGFRDTAAIGGGTDWSNELADAVARAWACISLYTPNYFKREACGKEVQVFLDRAGVSYDDEGAAQGSRGILPVLWASMQDLVRNGMPPAVVKRINFRSAAHQARYEREGLRQILRRSPRTVYLDIFNDIVSDLIDGFSRKPDPLQQRADFMTIRDAFAARTQPPMTAPASGPSTVTLFLIVHAHSNGLFAPAMDASWNEHLDDYDQGLRVRVTRIEVGSANAGVLLSQLEDCSQRNASVIVVLDPIAANRDQTGALDMLRACLASEKWTGALVLPDAAPALVGSLTVPPGNIDRIHVAPRANVVTLVSDLRTIWLEVVKRVVNEAEVKREPPGGGHSAERPKVKGPTETVQ